MKNDLAAEVVEPQPQDKRDDPGVERVSDVEVKQRNTEVKRKKPYVKPAFRYEKVFVTTALSCGKLSGPCMNSKVS